MPHFHLTICTDICPSFPRYPCLLTSYVSNHDSHLKYQAHLYLKSKRLCHLTSPFYSFLILYLMSNAYFIRPIKVD